MVNNTNSVPASKVKLTKKGSTHMPRTAYNSSMWQVVLAHKGIQQGVPAAELAAAILAAVPEQQAHMPMQFIKYQVRNKCLASA